MPFDGSVEDEIRRFEEQYRRQPESLVFARLADACRKAGDPERALALLEEGIERHPDYLSAHIVRARTFRDLGREVEARAAYERVLELDGQNLVAMRGLADLARRRNDAGDESRWLRRLVHADPFSPEPAERLAALEESAPESTPEPMPEPMPEPTSEPAPGSTAEATPDGDAVEAEFGSGPETADEEAGPPRMEPEDRREGDAGGSDDAGLESGEEGFVPTGDDRLPDPWWFESPETEDEDTEPAEEADADLLTRTMAELYARQGLLDEAEAIFRELLRDRPDDGELRAGLDSVLGMRAARSATRGTPPATRREPEASDGDPSASRSEAPAEGDPRSGEDGTADAGPVAEAAPTLPEELRELLGMGTGLARSLPPTPEEAPRPGPPAEPSSAPDPEPVSADRSVLEDWLRGLRG